MSNLTQKKCLPCEGIGQSFTQSQITEHLSQVDSWSTTQVEDTPAIQKEFHFNNFAEALAFTNQVGAIAESENHHPNILIFSYKHVKITLYTHALAGLTENDFIVAAKIDQL